MAKKTEEVIKYHATAKGILLAAMRALCGSITKFQLLPLLSVTDEDKDLEKLILQEKKDARVGGRDPQVVRTPYIWILAGSPAVDKWISAMYWDLNDSETLLKVQNFIAHPGGQGLNEIVSAAKALYAYEGALTTLPEGHPLALVPNPEEDGRDGEEDSKSKSEKGAAYKRLIDDKSPGGKEGLKQVGKDLKK